MSTFSSTTLELVIATTNLHKIREFKSMLRSYSRLDLRTLHDFPQYTPPPETGLSFEENAVIKATHASSSLNRWVLADDSGLVIPSIGGEPGIFSARYAGNDASDLENRKKLLDKMHHLLEEDRHGYYECALALASPSGLKKVTKGICEGMLLLEERGGGGFGYDPLFIKHGYSKTFAELDEETKNRISHRRKAFDKMALVFEALIEEACTI
jgi:XTP/dITP diphosphohydrolase